MAHLRDGGLLVAGRDERVPGFVEVAPMIWSTA